MKRSARWRKSVDWKKVAKWSAVAAGAALVAAAVYVASNSGDCEPPDMSKFVNSFEVPSDADNVYCGLAAATNVVNEKTGRLVLDEVFGRWSKPSIGFTREPTTGAEKDAILAASAKVLDLYHEAAQRKTWCGYDPSGKRDPFPDMTSFMRLCRLACLQAERRLELGETGAAIGDVRDMFQLARKIEHDAESAYRWLLMRFLLKHAFDMTVKIANSESSTDEDLVRLQEAMAQYDIASRPERALRMLNNEFSVYFAWMCDPENVMDAHDCPDEGSFSHFAMRVPFLAPYFYQRNRTLALCADVIEKMKEGVRSGYGKAAWNRVHGEIDNILSVESCLGPNSTGRCLLVNNFRIGLQINDFLGLAKSYKEVNSAVIKARLSRQAVE